MKKMRRLIPAIAMLLVSAVMLSTASFAWFTMNDQVTVEGMQIQAQGSGSLLIGDAPLTANSGKPSLTIDAGIKSLLPMAFNKNDDLKVGDKVMNTLKLGESYTTGWYKPATGKDVDIMTGKNDGTFAVLENSALALVNSENALATYNTYLYKEEFYLAVAGDAKSNASVQIDLNALAAPADNTTTYKAYAAAIYVFTKDTTAGSAWLDGGNVPAAEIANPKAIVYVDTTEGRNTVTLTGLNIPSVDGVATGSEVGLKVIVHFYVDGELSALNQDGTAALETVETGRYNYNAAGNGAPVEGTSYYTATADAGTAATADNKADLESNLANLYTKDGNNYVAATSIVVGTTYYEVTFTQAPINAETTSTAGMFTRVAQTAQVPYNYVRTAKVSTVSTALKLTFSLPTNP